MEWINPSERFKRAPESLVRLTGEDLFLPESVKTRRSDGSFKYKEGKASIQWNIKKKSQKHITTKRMQ